MSHICWQPGSLPGGPGPTSEACVSQEAAPGTAALSAADTPRSANGLGSCGLGAVLWAGARAWAAPVTFQDPPEPQRLSAPTPGATLTLADQPRPPAVPLGGAVPVHPTVPQETGLRAS